MKIKLLLSICFWLLIEMTHTFAQQNPMLTKYMFNTLSFNPAYAGSKDYMSISALHRTQWLGFDQIGRGSSTEGIAPTTQILSAHTPVNPKIGTGINLVNDQVGATASTSVNIIYTYRIAFGKGQLSLGIQGGMMNWRADWDKLRFKDPQANDNVYRNNSPSYWLPNFGAGLYYFSKKFYVGASVPHLINHELRETAPGEDIIRIAQVYRHYYFLTGAAFPLNGQSLIFKPSLLVKNVGLFSGFSTKDVLNDVGAPTEIDIDLSLFIHQTLWIGASFRSALEAEELNFGNSSFDSGDIWMAFYLKNGLRIGMAYDYTFNQLSSYNNGSIEIMLGYDFNYNLDKTKTPRYF